VLQLSLKDASLDIFSNSISPIDHLENGEDTFEFVLHCRVVVYYNLTFLSLIKYFGN